jgi:hypothetical protein
MALHGGLENHIRHFRFCQYATVLPDASSQKSEITKIAAPIEQTIKWAAQVIEIANPAYCAWGCFQVFGPGPKINGLSPVGRGHW